MRSRVFALLLVLGVQSCAFADDLTGAWLLQGLRTAERLDNPKLPISQDEAYDALAVTGFVRGVVAAKLRDNVVLAVVGFARRQPNADTPELRAAHEVGLMFTPLLFAPNELSAKDMYRTVRAYLERHPDQLRTDATNAVISAFSEAYPLPEDMRALPGKVLSPGTK